MQTTGIIQRRAIGATGGTWLGALHRILFRRIWLPRSLYAAVPVLYLVTGTLALWSAWSIPGWRWIHSLFALLGIACLNAGCSIIWMRLRNRRRHHVANPRRSAGN